MALPRITGRKSCPFHFDKEPVMKPVAVATPKQGLLIGLCLAIVSLLSVAQIWAAPLPGGTLDPLTRSPIDRYLVE
jgi:hypothetical protein